jgi:ABC-type transport system involved in multi-copper enzyme maturation permease subunit
MMRAWELMKETFFRKNYIPAVHVLGALFYVLLGLLPIRHSLELGAFLFIFSGCVLPLILSQGIFGDDIASGCIRVVLTKPMSFATPYAWRVAGLCLQCCLQLAAGSIVLLVIHYMGNKGSVSHLLRFNGLSLLMFGCLATLSTTLSTFINGGRNSLVIIFGALVVVVLNKALAEVSGHVAVGVKGIIKYAMPPAELLWTAGNTGPSGKDVLLLCCHAAGLGLIYAAIGISILSRREFPCEREY